MSNPHDNSFLPPGARGVRLGSVPEISVVVASYRERRLLDACLASLLPQCRENGAELVVARAADDIDALADSYPGTRFLAAPADATIPRLRAAGMAAVNGDIVLLTEDHCIVAEDWVRRLARSYQEGADVAGGSMGNVQRDRTIDWAAYFSEYGFFADNSGNAADTHITGANVAYSRRVIGQVVALAEEGEWENIIHERLANSGHTLHFLRSAAVYQNQNYRFWDFCRDRFDHGREFARRRLANEGGRRRWLYLPGTAALPAVLLARVGRLTPEDHRPAFLRALPLTLAFFAAWSLGEAVGYWRGAATNEAIDERS